MRSRNGIARESCARGSAAGKIDRVGSMHEPRPAPRIDPLAVACATCAAPPREPCIINGRASWGFHQERLDAACGICGEVFARAGSNAPRTCVQPKGHDGAHADALAGCPCGFGTNGRTLHAGGDACAAWLGKTSLREAHARALRARELHESGDPAVYDEERPLARLIEQGRRELESLEESLVDERRLLAGDVEATKRIALLLTEHLASDAAIGRLRNALAREGADADYSGRPTARLLLRLADELEAAELALRRARGPRTEAERAIGGDRLELGRDAGGRRHFLAGRPVNCGTMLEWNRGGIWTRVRYEASLHADVTRVVLSDALGEHELLDTDRFRWPERWTMGDR